jgi:hypothetical protein
VVWTASAPGGRLQHHRARHARVPEGLRPAQRTERKGAVFPCPKCWDCSTPSPA